MISILITHLSHLFHNSLSIYLSLSHSACLCLSICLYLPIFLSIYLYISLSPSLCLSLFLFLSVSLSVFLSASLYLSISLSIYLSVSLSLSLSLSLCIFVYLYVYICVRVQYVSGAEAMRISAQLKMEDVIAASDRLEEDLTATLNPGENNAKTLPFSTSSSSRTRKWWVPLLLRMEGEKNFYTLLSLQSSIEHGKDAYSRFKGFRDIKGLILLVGFEFEELQTTRQQAIRSKQSFQHSFLSLFASSSCVLTSQSYASSSLLKQ